MADPIVPSRDRILCPYIGLEDDPATCYAFPQPFNHCHRLENPLPIFPDYQESVCFSEKQADCPVLHTNMKEIHWEHFSPQRPKSKISKLLRYRLFGLWIIAGLILVMFLLGLFNAVLDQLNSIIMMRDASSAPLIPQMIEAQAAPTTPTPFPTSSPSPESDNSSTAVTGTGWRYIIHEVTPGETLDSLAIKFATTTAVIAQANPEVRARLTADALLLKAKIQTSGRELNPGTILVIIPGLADASGLPSFRPVFINQDILVEDLAAREDTSIDLLRYYNSLGSSILFESGRWVIIPEGD